MESAVSRPAVRFSGTALKSIACVSMLIDHIGASCLEVGVLSSGANVWASRADVVLRLIGRLAFPLYCFLLVEGFVHTHSVRRYALRLLLFALVSEVPFDWAFFAKPFYAGYQNVYFTLLAGLACLWLLRRFEAPGWQNRLAQAAALAGCGAAAWLARTDYDWFGVALIAVLYLLRGDPHRRTVAGCLLCAWEVTAPLAFLPIARYSGERGHCAKWEKYAFYAFYPVHLTLLALLTNLVLR